MMTEPDLLTGLPGFRDYFPEYWREIEFVLNKMRDVSLKYGYEEYEGPSVEAAALIEAKSGAELIKEIFQLEDRSKKRLLLRPEQTPTLARMLARDQQRYRRPMRWFSIPRLFRDETVQKGRVREFWQLNVDILGEDGIAADAETIAVAIDIFRACGLADNQFKMVINHRGLLNSYISSISDIDPQKIIPIIDKKMTLMQEYVKNQISQDGIENNKALKESLLFRRVTNSTGIYKSKLIDQCSDKLKELISHETIISEKVMLEAFENIGLGTRNSQILYNLTNIKGTPIEFVEEINKIDLSEECLNAISNLTELTKYLDAFGVLEPIIFDASLARGLDYYTGIVYEAFDTTGEIVRALCGGGRYDDLVSAIGGSPLQGTGFGLGETVLLELLKLHKVIPNQSIDLDLYLAPIKNTIPDIIRLATKLRADFKLICNPFAWRVKRHFEIADHYNSKIILLLGPKDIEKGIVSVRIVESGEQLELQMDDNLTNSIQKLLE